MPKQPAPATPRPHYTDATEQTFREALETLKKTLPAHHAALTTLVDEGRFHDAKTIVTLLEQGAE